MVTTNQETLNQVRKLGRSEENFELLYTLTAGLRSIEDSGETTRHISSILDEGNLYRSNKTKQNFGTFYRAIVGFLLARN